MVSMASRDKTCHDYSWNNQIAYHYSDMVAMYKDSDYPVNKTSVNSVWPKHFQSAYLVNLRMMSGVIVQATCTSNWKHIQMLISWFN